MYGGKGVANEAKVRSVRAIAWICCFILRDCSSEELLSGIGSREVGEAIVVPEEAAVTHSWEAPLS
jgi:hypothetical protein